MRPLRALIAAVLCAALAACSSSGPALAPAQVEAVETRSIDAPPDSAFRAAAGVMLDRGMMIKLSDRGAGLVGGYSWMRNPSARHEHSPDSLNGPTEVIAWVRPDGPSRSLLRVQFAYGGRPKRNADEVSRFAEEVSKRTLLEQGPRIGP